MSAHSRAPVAASFAACLIAYMCHAIIHCLYTTDCLIGCFIVHTLAKPKLAEAGNKLLKLTLLSPCEPCFHGSSYGLLRPAYVNGAKKHTSRQKCRRGAAYSPPPLPRYQHIIPCNRTFVLLYSVRNIDPTAPSEFDPELNNSCSGTALVSVLACSPVQCCHHMLMCFAHQVT